MNIISYRFSKT